MKQCVIISAMPVSEKLKRYMKEDAFVIAADAGWVQAKALGVVPNLIVGDFDSSPRPNISQVIILPSEKDDTDTMYAARKALEFGYTEVVILGALGGRLDHTMANMQVLLFLTQNGVQAKMIDETVVVGCHGPGVWHYKKVENATFSFFAASDSVEGICLRGLYYPLEDVAVSTVFPIGISNKFVNEVAEVSVRKGYIYTMVTTEAEN